MVFKSLISSTASPIAAPPAEDDERECPRPFAAAGLGLFFSRLAARLLTRSSSTSAAPSSSPHPSPQPSSAHPSSSSLSLSSSPDRGPRPPAPPPVAETAAADGAVPPPRFAASEGVDDAPHVEKRHERTQRGDDREGAHQGAERGQGAHVLRGEGGGVLHRDVLPDDPRLNLTPVVAEVRLGVIGVVRRDDDARRRRP